MFEYYLVSREEIMLLEYMYGKSQVVVLTDEQYLKEMKKQALDDARDLFCPPEFDGDE